MEYISASPADTERIAGIIAKDIKAGDYVALYGELGAGKTAFTRGLVAYLAPECINLVHSPTFAIVNEYRGKDITVYHYDLYRLKSDDDLISTGFTDYMDDGSVIISEWSELFEDMLPPDRINIRIEKISENERRITVC